MRAIYVVLLKRIKKDNNKEYILLSYMILKHAKPLGVERDF